MCPWTFSLQLSVANIFHSREGIKTVLLQSHKEPPTPGSNALTSFYFFQFGLLRYSVGPQGNHFKEERYIICSHYHLGDELGNSRMKIRIIQTRKYFEEVLLGDIGSVCLSNVIATIYGMIWDINIVISVANISYYEILSSEIDTQVILNIYYQRYSHVQNNSTVLGSGIRDSSLEGLRNQLVYPWIPTES